VEPEQLQASVLKPNVQRRILRMAPAVLHGAAHPAELRLPVPFLHPHCDARTCLLRLQEVPPISKIAVRDTFQLRPSSLSHSSNNSIMTLHQKMYHRLHTALHIVRHRTNVPSKVHVALRCSWARRTASTSAYTPCDQEAESMIRWYRTDELFTLLGPKPPQPPQDRTRFSPRLGPLRARCR
jgi:hypothetical protein